MDRNSKHVLLMTIDEEVRPLSLRVLGAYAESAGFRTTLLNILRPLATHGHPVTFSETEIRRLFEFLKREHVTHLGCYLMTASLKPYAVLVRSLRKAGYTGIIMAGGVHVSLCPEESLVEGADYAVRGPGERPLEMIMNEAAPATIPGLIWRRDGTIILNPQTPEQQMDLNSLPFPLFRFNRDWVLMNGRLTRLTRAIHRKYGGWHGKYYDLVTSRGCAYRCAYCCNVHVGPVKRASVDRVIREIKHIQAADPGIRGINIQDDSFFVGSDDWVREFCRRMKEEVGLPFIVRMIPRYVTAERLEIFKSGGLQYVTMGLQSSNRINREVFNRKEDSRSFLTAARLVHQAGLWLSIDLIINNPYEREEDLREIALTLNSLPRPHWWVVALSLTPFPKTPLYTRCEKDRMLDQFATDPYDAMLMPTRPGGYLTPRFWLLLNTVVLPHVKPHVGARLIAMGPDNPAAARMVENLSRSLRLAKRASTWFRDNLPTVYSGLYRLMRKGAQGRSPGGMSVFD
jgi:anaerobic magnesium-protoporphyrin IX monomethyl ester cyclase